MATFKVKDSATAKTMVNHLKSLQIHAKAVKWWTIYIVQADGPNDHPYWREICEAFIAGRESARAEL